jgi:hypothetical protein
MRGRAGDNIKLMRADRDFEAPILSEIGAVESPHPPPLLDLGERKILLVRQRHYTRSRHAPQLPLVDFGT